MSRRLLLALVLLLAVLAACTTVVDTTTTITTDPAPTVPGSPPTTVPGETTTSTRPDLSGLEGLPQNVIDQLEELISLAQEIRELPFLTPPLISVVDEAEFARRIQETLDEAVEDLPADESLYRLLGLLPRDSDLESMLRALYGEQVAGFYDGSTGEIVVPVRHGGFTLLQQGTMIHELVHALTDQHFGLHETRQRLIDEERFDEATAYLALIEGDAVFAELIWVQSLSQREIGQYIGESLAVDSSVLDSMPQFIYESLLFPYQFGVVFVQELHSRGGWEAVNHAYGAMPDLPGSTEQIINPANYARDLPKQVEPIPVEVPGYDLVTTSTWGELGFRLMFNQVLGESASLRAAGGWGGDFYHQWFDGDQAALLLVYEGDTPTDVEEMRTALLEYRRRAVPESAFVWVAVRGERLYFIAADDPTVGALLRTEMGLD